MKKQILYPGFIIRMLAFTLDITFISLIITPLNSMVNPFFFKTVFHSFLIQNNIEFLNSEVIMQLFKDANFQSQITFSNFFYFLFLSNILSVVLLFGYLIVGQVKFSTTLGKRLFNVKIVDFVTMQRPSIWQIINRSFFLWLGLICVPMILFSKQKRGMHDLIASTIVIKR